MYATAYVILTKTSDAISKMPTATPNPTQPTATATPTAPGMAPVTAEPVILEQPAEPNLATSPTIPDSQQLPQSTSPPLLPPTPSPPSLPGFNPPLATNTLIPTLTQLPQTSTPPVTPPPQGLLGIWQQDPTGLAIQFKSDNSYLLSNSLKELDDNPVDEGQYAIVGDQVTLTGSFNSSTCKGLTSAYQFQAPSNSQRQFTLVNDPCTVRLNLIPGKPWFWMPVRPGATPVASAEEVPIKMIPLSGPLTNAEARITDLTWYNDSLLLLPQFPTFTGDGKSNWFTLGKTELTGYLNGVLPGPLSPQPVPFVDSGLSIQLTGFQGYQAAVISGEKIFLLAQADPGGGARSYLVAGNIASDLSSITLDANRVVEVPIQPSAAQRIYSSLLISGENILALPQLSGAAVNSTPVIQRFDKNLNILEPQSISGIEYLTTDASMPETTGRFWVLNKFAPGDSGAINGLDPLAQLYGEGLTHQVFDQVERLVAFQVGSTGASLAAVQPYQLELSSRAPRNWQGLTELGQAGFFIVSNQSSGTLLVFIEAP